MASGTETIQVRGLARPVSVGRVGVEDREGALSVLLTGREGGGSRSLRELIAIGLGGKVTFEQLWGAWVEGRLVAAALLSPCAGRAAMCFVSPVSDTEGALVVGALVRAACGGLDGGAVKIVQCLVDPIATYQAGALEHAGFDRLAHLVYMERETPEEAVPAPLAGVAEQMTWEESRRGLFSDAIVASYEDTLDCPGLVGVRAIEDVIESHMATGRFDPEFWHVYVSEGRPVAVMLLNPIPDSKSLELVYLGISPGWRGRRVGSQLLRYGLWLGRRDGAENMVLAVDEANGPALKLYARLGFIPRLRKLAMMYQVNGAR